MECIKLLGRKKKTLAISPAPNARKKDIISMNAQRRKFKKTTTTLQEKVLET